jgi:hypothetical protein
MRAGSAARGCTTTLITNASAATPTQNHSLRTIAMTIAASDAAEHANRTRCPPMLRITLSQRCVATSVQFCVTSR